MTNADAEKNADLRELGEADRAYRVAFRDMTGSGHPDRASFRVLLAAVERLEAVVRRLEQREAVTESGGG